MNAVKSSGTLAFFGASGEDLWAWQQKRSLWPEGIWPYRWDGLGPAPIWLQCAVTSGDCFVHHKPATGFANLTLDQLRVGLSFADPSLYVGGGGLAFDTTDSDGMRQMELFMK